MTEPTREELFQEYSRLVNEETELLEKVRTYEECVAAILGHLFRHGGNVDLQTVKDILQSVFAKEQGLRSELLELQLVKAEVSFRHSTAREGVPSPECNSTK